MNLFLNPIFLIFPFLVRKSRGKNLFKSLFCCFTTTQRHRKTPQIKNGTIQTKDNTAINNNSNQFIIANSTNNNTIANQSISIPNANSNNNNTSSNTCNNEINSGYLNNIDSLNLNNVNITVPGNTNANLNNTNSNYMSNNLSNNENLPQHIPVSILFGFV